MLHRIDNVYDVSIATSKDAKNILFLLKDVATWLSENNVEQWGSIAEGKMDEDILDAIRKKEMFCVKKDEKLVATFVLYQKQATWDRNLWGDLNDHAIYIHRFALMRSAIGSGLGSNILQWVESYAKNAGIKTLRLDCVEENEKLNHFYNYNNFEKQGVHHGFSLYEKRLY